LSDDSRWEILDAYALQELPLNTKVVAVRWDIVQFALVLDLDLPVPRTDLIRRAWIVFPDIDAVTVEFEQTNTPTGIFLDSGWYSEAIGEGKYSHRASVLLPWSPSKTEVLARPGSTLEIVSLRAFGVATRGTFKPASQFGAVFLERCGLVSDGDMHSRVLKELELAPMRHSQTS
jgi:hypothetical protein